MSIVIQDNTAKARISKNLIRLMKLSGISQADLARATGESEMRISHYKNGGRIPSLAVAARIAEALNCEISELLR